MMTLPDRGQTNEPSKNGQGDGFDEADQTGIASVSLAERVIERFGGIRPMASKLSVPVTTVQGWKKRGAIPPTRLNDLREAAKRYGIGLTEEELARLASGEDRVSDAAGPSLAELKPAPPEVTAARPASMAAAAAAPSAPAAADADAKTGAASAEPVVAAGRGKTAQRPGEAKEIPPIESAAEIPPIEIPRFEIPPAEVPLAGSGSNGESARPPGAAAPQQARGPQTDAPPASEAPEASDARGLEEAGSPLPTSADESTGDRGGPGSFSSWTGISLLAALLALVCAAIAIYFATAGTPTELGGGGRPRDLERRITDVESKVSRVALEQVAVQSSLEQRINAVDARVDDASQQAAATAARLADRITALEQTIPELEKKIVSMPMGSPTLAKILAASQLRSALEKPTPFKSELEAVRIAGISNPRVTQALEQIEDRATTGIATETWLTIRFPAFSDAIIEASTAGNPVAQVVDGVTGLMEYYTPAIYRFAGYASSDSARAIVARAEKALRAGNFQTAIDELARLNGAAALEAEPWLAEARARLAANQVRTVLNNHMIALAAAGPRPE